jgi:hypothetical protein
MHWWTWVVMGAAVLAGLVTLAGVARGSTRGLPALLRAQTALQARLKTDGEALSARADELVVGPLELLELRARRTREHVVLVKPKRRP